MQEQQRDTEAVLLKKRVSDELGFDEITVCVERYKIKEEKTFKDGFKLEAGDLLRKSFGREKECGHINVIFEGDEGIKRMFWIKKSELDFFSVENEIWNRYDFEKENKDTLESWFE
jgi:hypothetical protein